MLDNKMILAKVDVFKTRKNIALFLAGFMVLLLAVSLDVHAAGTVKADGILTSIERDGTVIIDNIGYLLSPSVKVHDYEGSRISIHNFKVPLHVHFEYEYTAEGFVIIFIKENAV
jgi:hypothetical protein